MYMLQAKGQASSGWSKEGKV